MPGQFRKAPRVTALLALAVLLLLASPGRGGELRPVDPRAAPALALPDIGGVTRHLDAWRGRVVLLNFWAGWCQPCVAEMPGIGRLVERMHGRPFAVVTVNVAETPRRAAQTMTRLGLDLPVLLDSEGAAFRAWGGKGLPTSVLIDHAGVMRYVGLGPLDWDGAEAGLAIEGLLEAGGGKDFP